MREALIITGGSLDFNWAEKWLCGKTFEWIIAADKGLYYADKLGVISTHILGDYDSLQDGIIEKYSGINIKKYPCEKDYTDTHLAIIKAISLGAERINIIGATGTRMDHTMTNVFNMKLAADAGIECFIYDKNNKIRMIDESKFEVTLDKEKQYGDYVSIIPMSSNVVISLSGFKYNLEKYKLEQGISICQSNEIADTKASVYVHEGAILLFETKD